MNVWQRILWALVVILLLMGLAACALPNWRVFQKKVPIAETVTPAATTEGQRRAAKYIATVTTPPVPDPTHVVEKVHEVAVGLSASLGEPDKPVTIEDYDAVVKALAAGLKAKDAQLERWREFGRKYAGKPLEDTGINLAGPMGLLGLVGVIAACIACPPIAYAILRVLPVLWGFFRKGTAAVAEFAKQDPEAGSRLAVELSRKLDSAQKRLVRVRAADNRIPQTTPA